MSTKTKKLKKISFETEHKEQKRQWDNLKIEIDFLSFSLGYELGIERGRNIEKGIRDGTMIE